MQGENRIVREGDHFRYHCSNGLSFIFDEEDLPLLESSIFCADPRGYVTTNRKHDLLSHLLMQVDGSTIVDHVNGDPFDNRRCNLRIAEGSKNKWNYRVTKRSSTGYKGIYPDRRRPKFHARICVNGKRHYLGAYTSAKEAAKAYDDAAREYFGEFAALNFPDNGEQGCNRGGD